MSGRSAPLFLIVMAATSLPSRADDSPPTRFITSLGTHTLHAGKLIVKIFEVDGMINYQITRKSPMQAIGLGPSEPQIKKGPKWFVFPVSPEEVWIYDGGDILTLFKVETIGDPNLGGEASGCNLITSEHPTNNIVRKAPKEVIDRLPDALKEKSKMK